MSIRDITQNPIFSTVNRAVNAGRTISSFLDSASARLASVGLNVGGSSIAPTGSAAQARFASEDRRARLSLSPGSPNILYKDPRNALLRPLLATNGLVWPYTPAITTQYSANYVGTSLPHTNYMQQAYNNSNVDVFSVIGQMTANTPEEASYILAVINFLRASVKMFYGQDQERGTPPPVMRFSAYGPYLFNSVPVVITNFSQEFSQDVDYIEASTYSKISQQIGDSTLVPTSMMVNVTLTPIVTRNQTRSFSLEKYARGELIGNKNGIGGMP